MIQAAFTVQAEEATASYAKLIIEPLEKGFAHTLGNALRRVMLSSIQGAAVTSVRMNGVNHQFTTLEGMSEDVVEFLLNVKQLRLKCNSDQPVVLRLSVKNKAEVTAADIEAEGPVEILNKDLHLATLAKGKSMEVEMIAERGYGYSVASERKSDIVGMIPVDALFSPVTKVAYTVEATRVGRRTDYDRLVMQVWTDSTIAPQEALEEASTILVNQFQQITNPVSTEEGLSMTGSSVQSSSATKLAVEELELPTRIANALRKGGYKSVEDLLGSPRGEIAKVKNLGDKSVVLVEEALNKRGLSLKD